MIIREETVLSRYENYRVVSIESWDDAPGPSPTNMFPMPSLEVRNGGELSFQLLFNGQEYVVSSHSFFPKKMSEAKQMTKAIVRALDEAERIIAERY